MPATKRKQRHHGKRLVVCMNSERPRFRQPCRVPTGPCPDCGRRPKLARRADVEIP